jgi:hypothetical protein
MREKKNSCGLGCVHYHVTATFFLGGGSYLNAATIAITINGFQEIFQEHELSEEKSEKSQAKFMVHDIAHTFIRLAGRLNLLTALLLFLKISALHEM